jgi:GNAT superfamily N-acetyltransferase
MEIEVRPADANAWPEIVALFGPKGASVGCWCMFWRLPNNELKSNAAQDNKAALESVVCSSRPAGLLAYVDGEPVGWCAVAPRAEFRRLPRTKALELTDPDDDSVWSVTCFVVRRDRRRAGVATALLDAAVEYARSHGASAVEGYPSVAGTGGASKLSTGTLGLFGGAGFTSPRQPSGRLTVVRREL